MRRWLRSGPRPRRGSSVKPRMALSKASKARHEPRAQPVLRHVQEAELAQAVRIVLLARTIARPLDARSPPSDRPAHAGERLQQLALAVAGDARDADDLARAHREATRRRRAARRAASIDRQVVDLEHRRARRAAPASRRAAARGGRPSARRARAAGSSRRCRGSPTISPRRITETRSVTAMISRSLCVIRMIVLPCAFERAQQAEQLRRPRPASAPPSARRGSGCRRRGRAPSGSRRAAAGRPRDRRRSRRDRSRARSRGQAAPARRAPWPRRPRSSAPPSAPSMTFSTTVSGSTSMKC